ncbi:hypothetical protein HGRIS_013205 [Hohenbuehelia grisea]|uniref:MutS protein homolog 3 n=1 Tax=Hohenbuehelia grisea TaxID=104357 RepID=A0ABR3IUZ7_9AGAR
MAPTTQPVISAFFSSPRGESSTGAQKRRHASPIDLTLDSDEDTAPPSAKRQAVDHPSFSGASSKPKKASALPRSRPPAKSRQVESDGTLSDDSDRAFSELSMLFANKTSKGTTRIKNSKSSAIIATSQRKPKGRMIGPRGEPCTPLDEQIIQLKKENPNTLLMVEVGYKFKFFGEDAEIASRVLRIECWLDRNFMVASIPVHRKNVHLKNLLSQGHRVGVVNQIETAALKKVSDNKGGPFVRKLTSLHTAATYVDDLDSVDDVDKYTSPPLMCLIERWKGTSEGYVTIGMIAISPSTGDIVWDEYQDGVMRIELETRLVHTRPAELLLPRKGLSKPTEKMLSYFTNVSSVGNKTRIERFSEEMSYTEAFDYVAEYVAKRSGPSSSNSNNAMAIITDFPSNVVVVLAQAIKHLSPFEIADTFLEPKFFKRFTDKTHMLLAANTLSNLEIYRNETDGSTKGSLMWILDHTRTKFGARMLKDWVGRPLTDRSALQDRVNAVEELVNSTSEHVFTLRDALRKLPDLAKGLCRIHYGQATASELAIILVAFQKLGNIFNGFEKSCEVGCDSPILNDIIFALPKLKQPTGDLLDIFDVTMASKGELEEIWKDETRYPKLQDLRFELIDAESDLEDELKSVRKILRRPSLKWTTSAGEEYLVELKKEETLPVPDSWYIVHRTKKLARYRTPRTKELLAKRDQIGEQIKLEAIASFKSFLNEISQKHYALLRDVTNKLAVADCLLSLAHVASKPEYARPKFAEENVLEIVDGRHPMVEELISSPVVPNSVFMGTSSPQSKIITGPNMGGKSSCVRMIALIVLMAQVGSYVPAASCTLGMFDSILSRMGASDDLARGRSTFMVEMSETSEILQLATPRSLVILDELGRGTSTFDGMAIASAVLEHLINQTLSKTLFITHYPAIANQLEKLFPKDVENLHMGYTAEQRIDGVKDVTFLYKLIRGMSNESFGVECGRLAGLPESILQTAAKHSLLLQEEVEKRRKRNTFVTLQTAMAYRSVLT